MTATALPAAFSLVQDAQGRWVYTGPDGIAHAGVSAVRAFPVSGRDQGFALVSAQGRELLWIDRLDDLPAAARDAVQQALQSREFMPVILRLTGISRASAPCVWQIETDRGPAQLDLKGEEDIRRISADVLLVSDRHGVQFLIRHPARMDRYSRRLLDRFL
ncbi:DUF1854 domain-containing protein [Amphibiibacter pelophylacis]|uniref:DUF1854 domain-containing protein n=1 Tax=Amphibiibacter pelophylacis TaxID=1799477 RepID=A0ACC6NZN2_9BURK